VTVAATARPTCRTLCAGAYLTADKLSAASYDPLTHSRHIAGYRSANVGHGIHMAFSDCDPETFFRFSTS